MSRLALLAGVVALTAPFAQAVAGDDAVVPAGADAARGEQSFSRLAQVRTSRDPSALELAFWNTIKDSTNPADFRAYLEAFPEGTFAPLARVRSEARDPGTIEEVELAYTTRVASNVRAEPTAGSARVAALPGGAQVQVTGRSADGNWLRVALSDGRSGFVFGELLEPSEPAAAPPPVVAEAPPPAPAPPADPPAPPQVAALPPPAPAERLAALDPLERFRDCDTCPEMVVLPPGDFVMGNDQGDKTQRPARRVEIPNEFAIGRFEVTVAEWRACEAAGSCPALPAMDAAAADSPVRNVSWEDARQYAAWLSQSTGRAYRLPTEAEWEYAARGGTRTTFAWGDDLGAGLVACRDCGGEWNRDAPGPVGTFEPNALGLFDMHGSVAEWTADCWSGTLENTPSNGRAFDRDNCRQRVLRGGSWRSTNPAFLASAARFFYDAPVRFVANGFRVATDR